MSNKDDPMRQRADWMKPADDRILELLRDLQGSTADEIHKQLPYSREYISRRLTELAEYGMIEKPSRGLYRFTEIADEYLDEELDASTLERDE